VDDSLTKTGSLVLYHHRAGRISHAVVSASPITTSTCGGRAGVDVSTIQPPQRKRSFNDIFSARAVPGVWISLREAIR
jgi:hypothetical protein